MSEHQTDAIRADAQQNRERILAVAREAFAQSGDTSMNSIAKRAGVGAGTLYRHFPSREDLVLAVYRSDVEQLADAASAVLAEQAPIVALRSWLDRFAHYGLTKHGLAGALHAVTSDGLAGDSYEPVIGAITWLLQACVTDGSIGPGHDPDDVLLILGFLWRIDPGPDASARAGRLLDLVIAGLQATALAGSDQPGRSRRRRSRRSHRSQGLPSRRPLISFLRSGRRGPGTGTRGS